MFRTVIALILSAATVFAAGELSGRRAPGFALPDLQFNLHDPADYRGKILILEIMQTTCPHCVEFSKILEEAKVKYGDRVAILSIVNPPDNQTSVAQYMKQHKVTSPLLFDCGQVAASYLKITPTKPSFNIPHVFLIDQQGDIRNDFGYGPLNKHIFEGRGLFAEIDRLLGAPAKPAKGGK